MAIVKMKRLRLVAMRSDQEELLRRLRKLGCVEIDPAAPEGEDAAPGAPPDPRRLDEATAQANQLQEALDILKRDAPAKEKLLRARPMVAEGQLFDDALYQKALEDARAIAQARREINTLRARRGKLESQLAGLAPWLELGVPLELTGTRETAILFGTIPRRMDKLSFTQRLDEATELYDVSWAGEDREFRYLMLVVHRSALEEVQGVLLEAGFNRLNLQEWSGAAVQNEARLREELRGLDRELAEAQEDLKAKGELRDGLRLALDRAGQEVALERARMGLLDTQSAFYLDGWFPAQREKEVIDLLEQLPAKAGGEPVPNYLPHGCVAYEIRDPEPEEYPQVPIQLKNNPITATMNPITEMYSLPVYTGVDPNPWMAPFFILFFGFMMNDMAYGLLMVLGTALYLKLTRPKEGKRNFMMLFLLCGVSSIFWGALTGSFFGDFIPTLTGIMGHRVELPSLFTPMGDTIMVMIGSLILGAIQVFTGMAISVGHKFRRGEGWDAVFNEISWWIILGSGAWAILGGGTPALVILAVGGLMLLVGGTRKAKGFGKVTSAVGIVYNGVSGFFSDILSYVRLMALMLSGSVIASVFNTLGATFGSVIPFLIISLVGNALALVLNLLGCYVHTLRLQCLEFFGRFYQDGGKLFRPLTVETKYVDILKEEI